MDEKSWIIQGEPTNPLVILSTETYERWSEYIFNNRL